jgi:hypothetical protein
MELGGPSGTFLEKLRNHKYLVYKLMPEGWVYRNVQLMTDLRQVAIDSMDCSLGIMRPSGVDDAGKAGSAAFRKASPFAMLAKPATSPIGAALNATARIQTLINETLVVCGLERYRLARGLFPDKLDALVPQFIRVVPLDPVDGVALHYRHIGQGSFLLYSIGWDEKDNGGAPTDAAGNGDWVWGGH